MPYGRRSFQEILTRLQLCAIVMGENRPAFLIA